MRCKAVGDTLMVPSPCIMPRIVIRHRAKGAKKAQKRIRKDKDQNKILLGEFQKCPQWSKSKIIEL